MSFLVQWRLISLVIIGCLMVHISMQSPWALTIKSMSIKALTTQADLIVVAEVTQQKVIQSTPAIKSIQKTRRPWIYTLSTVQVEDCIKGSCPHKLVVSQVGGQLKETRLEIPGQKLLASHQKVLLFLKRKPESSHYIIVGFNQGVRWIDHPSSTKPNSKALSHQNTNHVNPVLSSQDNHVEDIIRVIRAQLTQNP